MEETTNNTTSNTNNIRNSFLAEGGTSWTKSTQSVGFSDFSLYPDRYIAFADSPVRLYPDRNSAF
jgi:hypothetical protein